MSQNESKLKRFERKLFETCLKYADIKGKTNVMTLKVSFFGLLLTPNIPSILNFDILYLYKAFQDRHIETRIHDPHISGSEALQYGVHLGRQSEHEKWTHNHDVIVLSTPHSFYMKYIDKMLHMFKPDKQCLWLDIYGAISPISMVAYDNVDHIDFYEQALKAELMGIPQIPPQPKLDWKPSDPLK